MSDYQGEQYRTPYQPTFEQPQTYGATPYPQGAVQPYQPVAMPSYVNPSGRPLVSAGGRLGAALLDGLLMFVTLWIGWIIWAMFTWSTGQTPAKQLLGHVVADAETGAPFDWGRMALREFCVKGLLGTLLNACSFGIYFLIDSLMIFNDRQQTLHDKMANSIVRHI